MAEHDIERAIATVSLSGTLEGKLRAAAAAGFDAIEIFEPDLIVSPCSPEDVRRLVEELGLQLDVYQPLRDFEGVDADQLSRNLRRAEAKFALMERLGTRTLLVSSNVSPSAIDDDDLAAEQLHKLAGAAADRGLRLAYEALAWGTHVNDYEHSWRIVREASHPALGICLDSFHILSRGSDPASIATMPAENIFMLQLADAPRLPMAPLQWSRHHRCFPGQGDLDIGAVVRHALAAGYRGAVSLEVFNDVFRQVPASRVAIDAMRSLLALEESLGLLDLSPAADLRGFAFAEVAADDAALRDARALLAALGFKPAARHVRKPVELWEQERARILLNSGTTARLAALAVESTDPDRSARRAIELKAPERSRQVAPPEVDMTEVEAPDGTSIFFCRSDASSGSWLRDFIPVDEPYRAGVSGIEVIDHVGLVQPFGHFDEGALFWRHVLGLRFAEGPELAAPEGLLRGRTLTNSSHTVVLALDGPLLGAGELTPHDIQHIAFRTGDAIAVARAARRAGLAVLSIPTNYYEDLTARFQIDATLLATLAELSILYDRDPEGGELLHFYTATVGGRLCFEVLERRRGYNGLGAVNAPVRLVAQATSL